MEQQIAIPLKRYACPDFTQTELDVYTRASSNIGAQSGVFPVQERRKVLWLQA